jgi:hypothetical protein
MTPSRLTTVNTFTPIIAAEPRTRKGSTGPFSSPDTPFE